MESLILNTQFKMEEYFYNKLKEIHLELETMDMDSCDISIEIAESMIQYLEKEMTEIRTYFQFLKSISEEDEILFFKEIKSEILGFLLYFNKIHTIAVRRKISKHPLLN